MVTTLDSFVVSLRQTFMDTFTLVKVPSVSAWLGFNISDTVPYVFTLSCLLLILFPSLLNSSVACLIQHDRMEYTFYARMLFQPFN